MELLDKMVALEEEAAEFGFRWQNAEQIMQQIQSECSEIEEHLHQGVSKDNQSLIQDEIGDLLHAAFSLCVFHRMSPRVTLSQALTKFERRLRTVKLLAREEGFVTLEGESFDLIMSFWDRAKELVG